VLVSYALRLYSPLSSDIALIHSIIHVLLTITTTLSELIFDDESFAVSWKLIESSNRFLRGTPEELQADGHLGTL
jgi:hypothetical protein